MEILEKDVAVITNAGTINSVIKVSVIQEVNVVGFPKSNVTSNQIYYFAKYVGIIKAEGTIYDADSNISNHVLQEIKSYIIY